MSLRRALNIYRSSGPTPPVQYIQATGGTEITYGNRKIHIFYTSGNFTVTQGSDTEQLDVFVVAGGGGGANGYGGLGGGGGGAGGYILTQQLISAGIYLAGIGSGGLGSPANTPDTNGSNGQNSTFNGLTAVGGGGGNTFDNPTSNSGGSAGGAAWNGVSGAATSGQGNVGGICIRPGTIGGGGGGGAGLPGNNSDANGGGNGGNGLSNIIAGVLAYYAGGGGGGICDIVSNNGVGGLGGGGRGGLGPDHNGTNGVVNTGSGGGGGIQNDGAGGSGGSGIVIVSYQFMASCYPNLNNVSLSATLIESGTSGYSTFQSNNQKVVYNNNGIFVVFIRTATPSYTAQTWRLKQSTDGGSTFTTLFDDDSAYSAPCLETDSNDNLYLIYPNTATDCKFYKFEASDYTTPSVTKNITGLGQEKYSMALDEANDRIYFVSKSQKFIALDLNGNIVTSAYNLVMDGIVASPEYPNLQVDNLGNLYCAWTSQKNSTGGLYWNISWMVSIDLGVTWQKADGTPITLPVWVDNIGPLNQVTRYIEYGKYTWLSSFIYANERLHFMYHSVDSDGSEMQTYARINPTTGITEVLTINPLVCNPTIAGLDGFFLRTSYGSYTSPDVLRFITTSENRYIVSSISEDNGVTWRRNKVIDMNPPANNRVYASGGFREMVGDKGYGTFTIQDLLTNPETGSGDTYFINVEI